MQNKRSESHNQLLKLANEILPGGILGTLTMPEEINLVADRGKGSRIYDMDGNEYIDYVLGSGPLILGHAHPSVINAVTEQLSKGTTYYSLNEPIIKLGQALISAIPCAEKIRFASSGSEATFYALRLARAYTKREKILKFEGAYHGHHDYAMMSFASQSETFPRPSVDSAGIPKCIEDTVLVVGFNDFETCESVIENNHHDLAAVIVEPYQRIYGPKENFIGFLREITSRYGIVLIFDELVTGFRIAYGGAQEYYGIIPDLATYGKIIAGGFPMSAVCGKAEIMDLCDPYIKDKDLYVYQSGTLNGNAICAAAGLATIEELQKPGVYDRLNHLGEQIRGNLEKGFMKRSIPVKVAGIGPMFNVLFTEEELTDFRSVKRCDKKKQLSFMHSLFKKGLFLDPRGVRSYISLVHTEKDLQETFRIFDEVIEEM
ncbi:MAG: aspartate aminotransferase family protein [Pseudomonadota bacterium]